MATEQRAPVIVATLGHTRARDLLEAARLRSEVFSVFHQTTAADEPPSLIRDAARGGRRHRHVAAPQTASKVMAWVHSRYVIGWRGRQGHNDVLVTL